MPQTLGNLARVPINGDALNITGDMASLAQSLEIVVPVASDAAGDTYASERAAAGFPVSDTRPLIVYNTTTHTVRIKDSSGWRDVNLAVRHAEFDCAAVTQNANAGVIFGTLTAVAGRTFNNTFCTPSGVGAFTINETGLYAITSWPQPPSSLGTSMHIFGTNSTEGTIMSSNFNSYGNAQTLVCVTVYLLAGTTCQFGVTGSNTVSGITARLKVSKIQGV